jgi:ubiquinone/menaquinone biosynthesis C-methylase UbiE
MTDKVKEFWDNQAKEHGTSDLATAPDHYYREHEINCILPLLNDGDAILDVGCGNGYATLKFAKACPNSKIYGVDYSKQMIEAAIEARGKLTTNNLNRIFFIVANVLDLRLDFTPQSQFDTIVCTRVLINLKSWDEQQQAILQMKSLLKPGGRLILLENTKDGLANLNSLRARFGLHAIKERWHNNYLPDSVTVMEFLEQHLYIENIKNLGTLYYLITRVLYAKLCQLDGKEPAYNTELHKIASELPNLGGHYSPNMMWVLRKLA